jgi:hypothetical protein
MAQEIDFRGEYNKIKQKLPSFDELNNDFEIAAITDKAFPLRAIRRKIMEKVLKYMTILESVIQPETHFTDLYESKFFSENERHEILILYKKLKQFERETYEIALNEDDKDNSDFINSFFSEWKAMKKQLVPLIKKLKNSWKEESKDREVIGYFG